MDANCFDDPHCEFREMGTQLFQPSPITAIKFMIMFFFPIIMRFITMSLFSEKVSNWMKHLLRENIRSRKNKQLPHEDVVHWLLNAQDKDRIDEHDVISHATSFFVEGFETSGTVLSFVLYALGNNPEIQTRLTKEIDEVLKKHNDELTFEALQDMTYLDCIVHG